ncbi:uncharacterized protein p-cup isoform X1 [Drosophila tropicalis]|uniref:uncharacterized protein p-cup isoform X1 n=2 Tax=Drosophila tropicalis TaxID=46794 RepID=UPI0035ABD86C
MSWPNAGVGTLKEGGGSGAALASGLAPDLKPWQRIDWPGCVQARLYKDWGQYYTRRLLNKKALECYGRARVVCKEEAARPTGVSCMAPRPNMPLEMRNCFNAEQKSCRYQYVALLKQAQCERSLAMPQQAWLSAVQAQEITHDQPEVHEDIILEQCDALYDDNRFEDNLCTLYSEANRLNSINNKQCLENRLTKTLTVFNHTVGDSLNWFFKRNFALIQEIDRRRKTLAAFVPRPLWKDMKEQNKCDVQSVIDKPTVYLTPLEKARRRVCQNVFNYQYLGRSAKDVAILRELQENPNFLNPHLRETTPFLRQFSAEQYKTVRKFMRMMHARNPLYNRNQLRGQGSQACERTLNKHLYRLEYQTRRDCFRMLREVRQRRRERNIERMTNYVERIMSTYIDLKTHRILPWKFEFVNEVYNILALAHVDRCAVPTNVDFLNPKNRGLLYQLPAERTKDKSISFCGPNLYIDIQKDEERHNRINQKLDNLDDRLRHSRYSIERCYLLFEMARNHFMESRFDKCLTMARKAVYEARNCKSLIWRFNSIFLVCQVHATLNRYERLKESLAKASQLANELKSPKLVAYLSICITVNDHDLGLRRMRYAEQYVRNKNPRSNEDSASSVSQTSNNKVIPITRQAARSRDRDLESGSYSGVLVSF